ncbi:MAG TPA: hypothetical protein ENI07_22245 [Desulfobacterales bacterium]|nr:hypothetical protein [Desulfobacterales bacterium]
MKSGTQHVRPGDSQGRFKSILIDADEYLKHLSRYIHLNPVRAKMVDRPSEFTQIKTGHID